MFSGRARINYLSTMSFDEEFLDRLRTVGDDVEVQQIPLQRAEDLPLAMWAQVDVLHTGHVVCHPDQAPRLRWVQLDTSGVDHLHDREIWASGAVITTIGGVSPVPLAEYVLWAILGTAHRMPELMQARADRHWPDAQERWARFLPAAVRGATLGILGYGRIGREIGRLAQAFGMSVLAVSRTGARNGTEHYYNPAAGHPRLGDDVSVVGPEGLEDVLARSDYLVVVLPLTEHTRGLLDARRLRLLKPGAVLVNVARGGIVVESALRDALRAGRLRAAVLDVFEQEPLPVDDGWWEEPGTFVTPHVSGLAPDYASHVLDLVQENLRRFREDRPLLNVVDRARGY